MQYQRQQISQKQTLKMSPQLYQSIKLMAMPIQELKTRIQEEVEQNPALEVLEEKTEASLDARENDIADGYEYFENSSDPGFTHGGGLDYEASDSKQKFLEGALSRQENLHDHLLEQLSLQPISEKEFEIGKLLINNLDDNGFHIEKPESLVSSDFNEILWNMVDLIQGLDPVGVCTVDFHESLIVQAKRSDSAPTGTEEILEKYFDPLKKGKIDQVVKDSGFSKGEIDNVLSFIRTLNPMPGVEFSTERSRYVVPDVVVREKDGELVIILNDEEIPVLGINGFFKELQDNGREEKKQKEIHSYVKGRIKDAQWFIRSIHQRNETLLKITKAIVEFQRDFFIKGPKYLVPLTLKDVADEVGVHETTVSRISNAKYMQTEWGIFEIKYFFSNSVSGTGTVGSRFSKEGVKAMISEILENNSSGKKLSDQKISDELKKRGVNIARRTVTKYRSELDILSSYDR